MVVITDDNDEPTVGFEKPVYEVVEPAEGNMQRLRICVVRTGDLTAEMEGRVHTKVKLASRYKKTTENCDSSCAKLSEILDRRS